MKIEITNRQKIKRVNLKQLRRYLTKTARLLSISGKKISLLLCDNKLITDLNQRYFKKARPTDVIAFNLSDCFDPDYLGEVVVSVEEAVKVSGQLDLPWQEELLLYCVHGVLHLLGYDDRSKIKRVAMEKKQLQIMRVIK
ncbi:MAG: rRNA maturation RNase YbeY [Candidatus Omnitrophica bacterium]|nr:rRNA maturation RNase YbeY [Candidatus Omnitrophota bacterium]